MSYVKPDMHEALSQHILVPMLESEKVSGYYLRRPDKGRDMSTLILFTPEGIVIQGDLTPGRNGNVSAIGYGRDWFSKRLSEDYLCEKFLSQEFVPAYATEGLRYEILQERKDRTLTKERARELWSEVPNSDDFTMLQETYDFWTEELGHEDGDGCPGYGYEPREAGWLCAIQQRFAALYTATAQASA